jgi:HSP20 family protein
MAITRWDPFGEIVGMQREMDRIMSRMGGIRLLEDVATVAWMPRADVIQRDKDLVLHLEVPGVKPEDVDINVTDNMLRIHGERKLEETKEGQDYILQERSYGTFERTMILPEGIHADKIKADFHDGVLEVTVPGAVEAAKPKTHKIPIAAGKK